jgi:hypothetical protein
MHCNKNTHVSLERVHGNNQSAKKTSNIFQNKCVRQRIMRNKIDVMLIQEFFIHHPWSIRDDFIDPPDNIEEHVRYNIATR